jgi:hypothetical protein
MLAGQLGEGPVVHGVVHLTRRRVEQTWPTCGEPYAGPSIVMITLPTFCSVST